ncbi:MAG: dipicolinate synthase subunit B [Clostridia bacterium]|nr:dipicolinate synthase subunit B [Clostridia bacterium]
MNGISLGYAMCGSFCTLRRALDAMKRLRELGAEITPIMSPIVYSTDTRFGKAEDIRREAEEICGRKIIHTIKDAEPIGPKSPFDLLVAAPCTGNTLSKFSLGITDTSVTMALKAHIRNQKPLLISLATNDALSATAKNIGALLNTKNVFFVPFSQDDPLGKPTSMIADFSLIPKAAAAALNGKQLTPVVK